MYEQTMGGPSTLMLDLYRSLIDTRVDIDGVPCVVTDVRLLPETVALTTRPLTDAD